MSYLIEDNNFTKDSRGVRATRLYFLSNRIDTYSVELSLTGALHTWAQGAVAAFDEAQDKQSAEIGEKNEAFQTSQEADAALQERYQLLKELLQARYGEADDKLQIYGITGPTPRPRDEVIDKAEYLIEGNDRQTAAGDPLALPQTMLDNLQALIDDAKDKYHLAGIERSEAEAATDEINNLYDADSKKLRSIYSWIVAFWGKFDPRLIELGFVPATPRTGGGQVPAAPVLSYSPDGFYWEAVAGATSYQLVYTEEGGTDWQEAYSGSDAGVVIPFNPGNGTWLFKVRARNANGYGEWSNTKTVVIGLQPPEIWEIVYNPSTNKVTLQWHASIGAEFHDVYQSIVPMGEPAGTFTLVQSVVGQVYQHDVSTYDVTEYYYIIARNSEETSEPTPGVFVDIHPPT